MTSPIDTNSHLAALNAAANINGANAQNSSVLNIPNDDQNRQWFLSENTGSRTPISVSNNAINGIDAEMGIDGIADRILSHVGA